MTVEAELADGRILEFPDGTDPAVVQATVKRMLTHQKSYGPQDVLGPAEAMGKMVSGSVAAPLAGLAGIAGAALPGPQGQGANWVQNVSQALTYDPRTKLGGQLSDVASFLPEKLAQGADVVGGAVAEKTGSPALGAGADTAIQMAPAIVSSALGPAVRGKLAEAQTEAASRTSKAAVKDATLNAGREAGYVVPPENSMLRGVAGKASLRQESIIRNQDVTNTLAKKAIDVPDDVALTPGVLEAKRLELSAPYRELSAINPTAGVMLETIKKLRSKANEYFKFNDRSGDPTALETAKSLSSRADGLEQRLDTIARIADKPELVSQMKEARTKIAKTYDIERAMNVGDGNIDAHIIGNLVDKNPGKYTGEIALIGKFDQAFRRYTQEASRIEAPGGASLVPHIGVGLGHATGYGFLSSGVPFLRPAATSLLLSDMYQTPTSYQAPLGLRAMSPLFDENSPAAIGAVQAGNNRRK